MAGLVQGSSRKTIMLGINGNGNIYQSSKIPVSGFVAHTNPLNGQLAGYWKEYPNGLVAWLNNIAITERPNNQGITVSYFVMSFRDYESEYDYSFWFPLYTPKGGLHRYVKSFIKYYKNIEPDRMLLFNAFKKKANDQYAPSELIFAYHEDGSKDIMVERYYKNGQNGWPDPEKKMIMGKEVTDYTAQNNFAFERLKEYIEEFKIKMPAVRKVLEEKYGLAVGSTMYEMPIYFGQEAEKQEEPQQQQAQQPQYQQSQPQYQQPQPQYQQQPQQQAWIPGGTVPPPTPPMPQQAPAAPQHQADYMQVPPPMATDDNDDLPF